MLQSGLPATRGLSERMASTPRKEQKPSTLLSIAQFCSKTSTILEVAKNLESMADSQVQRSETEAVRATVNSLIAGTQGVILPNATSLSKKLQPFPKRIMNSQAAQLVMYNVNGQEGNEERPDVDKIFYTQRKAQLKLDDVDDDLPHTAEETRETDFGTSLLPSGKEHRTTLRGCSCQFQLCWGLPCRHMFVVAHYLSWE